MNALILALILSVPGPTLGPFDPPPGPLPWQPVNLPDLGETDELPTVADFEEPTTSDDYADKLAETEAKIAEVMSAAEELAEVTDSLTGPGSLLPDSSGDDFNAPTISGETVTAYSFASDAGESIATMFAYIRAARVFLGSFGFALEALLFAAAWLIMLKFIEIAAHIAGSILKFVLSVMGIIPQWLGWAIKGIGLLG